MKVLKKYFVVLLALLMAVGTMSACSSGTEETTGAEDTATTAGETTNTAAGRDPVLTVNGLSATYGVFYTSLVRQKEYYEQMALYYYGNEITTEDWQGVMTSGETVAENLQNNVIKYLLETLAAASHAADYGIELSEEDKATARTTAETEFESLDSELVAAAGLDLEDWVTCVEYFTLYDRIQEKEVGNYTVDISDEDARTMTFDLYAIALKTEATETEAGAGESESTEDSSAAEQSETTAEDESTGETEAAPVLPTAEEAEQKIQGIFERIRAGEDAKTVIEEAGYTYYSDTMSVNQYTDEFSLKVMEMKTGDMISFQPDESTYYGVICTNENDAEQTEARKETLRKEKGLEYFYSVIEGWLAEAEVVKDEDLLSQIKVFQ